MQSWCGGATINSRFRAISPAAPDRCRRELVYTVRLRLFRNARSYSNHHECFATACVVVSEQIFQIDYSCHALFNNEDTLAHSCTIYTIYYNDDDDDDDDGKTRYKLEA